MGRCTAGKLQRILVNQHFPQHAKLNMASFVLYLPPCFALRFRMVGVCSKAPKIELCKTSKSQDIRITEHESGPRNQNAKIKEYSHQNSIVVQFE